MQYVDFGRTGLRISRLGFGGIPVQRIDEPGTWACGMNLSLPPSAVR